MISDLNRTTLIGYLAADAEFKTVNGKEFVIFSMATNSRWTDGEGNRQSKTLWHNVVVWNGRGAVNYAKRLKKGDRIYLEGELNYGSYDKKIGNDTVKIPTVELFATNIERVTERDADEPREAA